MLIVISPAKTLDYQSPVTISEHTLPELLPHTEVLISHCRQLTPMDIAKLMKVSDKIAGLNAARFEEWDSVFTKENSRQALLAFKGDVYTGLAADTLSEADFQWAQDHLRMLSGLYGVLRPLDWMQPYRLEMGTKLANERGTNLYQFWGSQITNTLNEILEQQESNVLINLASNEYFKSVKTAELSADVITPVFKDLKTGTYKIISFYAKKARGMMARYIIDHRIESSEELKAFSDGGYYFVPAESTAQEWVFKRDIAE